MTRLRRTTAVLASLALAGTLAACGSDASTEEGSDMPDMNDSAGAGDGMDGMDMSEANQPDATPADEVDGEVTEGTFTLLDTAPPGSDDVAGQAWLAQNDDGTTVTIRLSGLEPGVEYVSHLHAQSCSEDNGGPHFAFDPEGEEVPPNEVHLGFTASDDGTGEATVTNDRRVEDLAPSAIVHPADSMDNRLVCADFSS
ncbi:hypothetical protein GCM10027020_30150 [Nocardioides salsibiostraticola]